MILLLNLKTTFFRLFEWIVVVFRYYLYNPRFARIDFLLACRYLWKSPHRISKHFLRKQGAASIYAYGETPLTSLDRMVSRCQITSKDCFFELGCGPGRTCFWLSSFVKCQVVGIDYLPEFIEKANKVKKCIVEHKITFLEQDMLLADLNKATIIYLYGICLEEEVIYRLVEKFEQLPPTVKILTVSYPLSDYSSHFHTVTTFPIRFPWGKASLFVNVHYK